MDDAGLRSDEMTGTRTSCDIHMVGRKNEKTARICVDESFILRELSWSLIVLLVISFQFNESFDLSACPLLFQDAHIPG